ncbi:hypothetical protein [Streptomyces sp. G45]|uniref:hypothetical protein n=1 Tax=Streptomyces sp. G45 TaxID=3406627 RepID=UPI003C20BF7C
MTKVFLILHVLAAILAVGPVAVAASMFPKVLRDALAEPGAAAPVTTLRTLHRICRVYAGVGFAVVAFGFATASSMGVLNSPWLVTSIALTFVAAVVLMVLVLPRQEAALDAVSAGAGGGAGAGEGAASEEGAASAGAAVAVDARASARLAMFTGVFNLLWATVTILMIVRPGSTTGG